MTSHFGTLWFNLLIKRQSFLTGCLFCIGVALNFQFVWQKLYYNVPLAGLLQKHVGLCDSSTKYQKSFLCKMCFMVVLRNRTFYRNNDLSTTCQCWQLKLNLLSTQINIYCLMTNQTPALLVQCALWRQAAVMLLQSLYFSHPTSLPPPPPSYNPRSPSPRKHFKIEMAAINSKTCYISAISWKIGNCEQSIILPSVTNPLQLKPPASSLKLFFVSRQIISVQF